MTSVSATKYNEYKSCYYCQLDRHGCKISAYWPQGHQFDPDSSEAWIFVTFFPV